MFTTATERSDNACEVPRRLCLVKPYARPEPPSLRLIRVRWGRISTLLLLLFVLSRPLASEAASNSGTQPGIRAKPNGTSADFGRFLSERPPIKSFAITWSWPPEHTNFSFFEGALQPGTFYVKETVRNTGRPGQPIERQVAGAAYDNIWWISPSGLVKTFWFGTNASENALSIETEADLRNEQDTLLMFCEMALEFGICESTGSVRWLDSAHFERNCEHGMWERDHRPSPGKLVGELIGHDLNRPEGMEYKYSGRKLTYKVRYEYEDDGRRPSYVPHVIETKFEPGTNYVKLIIEKLALGTIDDHPGGFTFAEFLSSSNQLAESGLITVSNGVGKLSVGGGAYYVRARNDSAFLVNPRAKARARAFFFVFAVFSVCGIAWLMFRLRREERG